MDGMTFCFASECKRVFEALANSLIAAQKCRAKTWELKPVFSFSTSGRRLPSFLTPTCTSCIRWGLIQLLPILNSGERSKNNVNKQGYVEARKMTYNIIKSYRRRKIHLPRSPGSKRSKRSEMKQLVHDTVCACEGPPGRV